MAKIFIISVMAKDRAGIVAEVTGAIKKLDGNLADISQTVLRGYFTMIISASFPDDVTADKLRRDLADSSSLKSDDDNFEIGIKEANSHPETDVSKDHSKTYVLTAVGEDQAGLVAGVSSVCKKNGVNILDLSTLVHDNSYIMIFQLDLSGIPDISAFRKKLKKFSVETGLTVELQHMDIFIATNEI